MEVYDRMMAKVLFYFIISTSLVGGCAPVSTYDAGGPASHHAQRKYEEALRKGLVAPIEQGKADKK